MQYIRVAWKHTSPDDPILLYSELDDARWEVRKVEVFRSGKLGHACAESSSASTGLGSVPVLPLREIALDREFEPVEITQQEFEDIWQIALRPDRDRQSE
jgi:hypothetical protein